MNYHNERLVNGKIYWSSSSSYGASVEDVRLHIELLQQIVEELEGNPQLQLFVPNVCK